MLVFRKNQMLLPRLLPAPRPLLLDANFHVPPRKSGSTNTRSAEHYGKGRAVVRKTLTTKTEAEKLAKYI